jgi:hypothetical protein
MAKLFDIDNGKVVLDPSNLAIPVFKKIWDSDKSKTKEIATKELTYVVFLCDYKSPYRDYLPQEREEKIRKDIFSADDEWEPSELIKEAIKQYEELQQTTNSRLVESAKVAAEQLAVYFRNTNFSALDDRGRPIYTAKDLVANLKALGDVVKSLSNLEKQVQKEQLEASTIRGGGEIGAYELPDKEIY